MRDSLGPFLRRGSIQLRHARQGERALTDAPLVGGSRLADDTTAGDTRTRLIRPRKRPDATLDAVLAVLAVRRCVGYSSRKWSAPVRSRNHYFRSPLSVVRAATRRVDARRRKMVRPVAARGAAWREFLSFGTDGVKRATPRYFTRIVLITCAKGAQHTGGRIQGMANSG